MRKMIERIEDTLNGGYKGLYGEVVTEDSYRLKTLDFEPTVIFDCGANIGVFSRFANQLFPNAIIIAIEPNPDNCSVFRKFTDSNNIDLINKAIGIGDLYYIQGAPNGAHETYLSISDHVELEDLNSSGRANISHVASTMPDKLINSYTKENDKILMKIDIEGNENVIWEHQPSIDALKKVDYLTIEIHPTAFRGKEKKKAKENMLKAFSCINETHDIEYEHIYFFAKKRR